jgi:hypothetical protein
MTPLLRRSTTTKRLAAIVLLGILLGVAARLVDDVAPRWVGNMGAVWFLAAFAAGRAGRSLKNGAALGAMTLVAAWVAYYSMRLLVDETISMRYLGRVGIFWLLTSVAVGALAGVIGAASRRAAPPWGIAIGVPLGEAVAVAVRTRRWQQIAAELALAIALLVWSNRKAAELVRVTLATTVVVALIAGAYRTMLA